MSAGAAVTPVTAARTHFSFGGRVLAVEAADDAASEVLAATYDGLRTPSARGSNHTASLRRSGDGRLQVRFDRRPLSAGEGAAGTPVLSAYYGLKEVFARFSAGVPHYVAFYGALVAVNGSAVMLLGPSCSGKTLLAMHLAALGATFLGDETTALDVRTGLVRALPRKAAIREAALELLPAHLAQGVLDCGSMVQTPRGRFWYALDGPALRVVQPSAQEHRLSAIFILRDRAGSPAATLADPVRSFPALLQRAYSRPFQLMEVSGVKRAIRGAAVFDLESGSPAETAALIMQQVRTCA